MTAVEKVKSLLADLGKPTLRGVKKCPKCGTFNGTRGINCKNKTCGAIFKERSGLRNKLKPFSTDAVRINTGSTTQLFSVRMRDRGPDYRGFVQLPSIPVEESEESLCSDTETTLAKFRTARCYLETCAKSSSISNSLNEDVCQHIQAALRCNSEAQPLSLKNSALNSLSISSEIKQSIWLLATESPGPLVQRVSKNVMVIKCKVSPRHPLGFLHLVFFESPRNKDVAEQKFSCSCKTFKAHRVRILRDEIVKRCVHFYACICAFTSDEKLLQEFAHYVHSDISVSPDRRIVSTMIAEENLQSLDCKVELLVFPEDQHVQTQVKKRKKEDMTLSKGTVNIDETKVTLSFHQWLASITERINQTMHYQFDGNPEPLVFHVPQVFFDCLQQRIATGFKKKRLPNSTTAFVRKDALPLGTFSKYTWHITNGLHVKQIFDTAELPLEVTRSFVENRDGTYDLYDSPQSKNESYLDMSRKSDSQPIRPFELKTFLKVGIITPDQREPTPFIIEWIPNILPKQKIGELRLKFQYGHQRNGQIEYRAPNLQPSKEIIPL